MQDAPSPIALEPCSGNRAAVLSLLVRLPSGIVVKAYSQVSFLRKHINCYYNKTIITILGGLNYSSCGQSTGLAIASALVTLGNPRKLSMEHPKETKKRKQSQHPDNCI